MADTLDLGSNVERRRGSSPLIRTNFINHGLRTRGRSTVSVCVGSIPTLPTTLASLERILTPVLVKETSPWA